MTVAAYPILCGLKRRHGEIDLTHRAGTQTVIVRHGLANDGQYEGGHQGIAYCHRLLCDLLPTCGKQAQRVRWAANPIC